MGTPNTKACQGDSGDGKDSEGHEVYVANRIREEVLQHRAR